MVSVFDIPNEGISIFYWKQQYHKSDESLAEFDAQPKPHSRQDSSHDNEFEAFQDALYNFLPAQVALKIVDRRFNFKLL